MTAKERGLSAGRSPDRSLASWRQDPSIGPIIAEMERQGLVRTVDVAALVASGVPQDAVDEWSATVREPDPTTLLGADDPAWLAMALTSMSWHYTTMTVREGARWSVMADRLGRDLFDMIDAWEPVDRVCGWAFEAAGLPPDEVLAAGDARPQQDALLTMAALRGTPFPADWFTDGLVELRQ